MIINQQLETAQKAYEIEEHKNKKLVFNYFKNLTTESIKLTEFDTYASDSYWPRARVEISFLDTEGKSIFGSDLTLSYYNDKGLALNHGSMGEYSLVESNPQLTRLKLLAIILNHTKEIEDLFKNLDLTKQEEYFKIKRQYNKEQEEVKQNELASKRLKVQADLKVGKEFTLSTPGLVKLISVGPKQVKYEYYISRTTKKDVSKMNRLAFVEGVIKNWSNNYGD